MYGDAICLLGSLLEGGQWFLGLEVLGPLDGSLSEPKNKHPWES